MKKPVCVSILILVLMAFNACAPLPRTAPAVIDSSASIDKPFDAVWASLIEYLSSRQIQIKTINKESGFLDTEFMLLPSHVVADYAWTGQRLPSLLHDRGRIKANVFLKKVSDSQTSVTVNSWVQVFETYPAPGRWFDARSTGLFESRVLNAIK